MAERRGTVIDVERSERPGTPTRINEISPAMARVLDDTRDAAKWREYMRLITRVKALDDQITTAERAPVKRRDATVLAQLMGRKAEAMERINALIAEG